MHPEELVKPPPPKDRTIVKASATMPGGVPSSYPPTSPMSMSSASTSSPRSMSSDSVTSINTLQSNSGVHLAREKNRLTLRAYLHSLMTSSKLASSPVLRSFLLSGPTKLSPEELDDAKRREDADRRREEGKTKFAREIAARVEGLRGAVKNVKGDTMSRGKSHICCVRGHL
jgi:hypothetical protein